jgi:hypothetical protein
MISNASVFYSTRTLSYRTREIFSCILEMYPVCTRKIEQDENFRTIGKYCTSRWYGNFLYEKHFSTAVLRSCIKVMRLRLLPYYIPSPLFKIQTKV